jgi:hypothetical protein
MVSLARSSATTAGGGGGGRGGERGQDLRERSCRLRCSLRLKARLQNWHLYFFSGAEVFLAGLAAAGTVGAMSTDCGAATFLSLC